MVHWWHMIVPLLLWCRERKEKLNNAKRYATHVSKSNLSIEARQVCTCWSLKGRLTPY